MAEIVLVALFVGISCALIGSFLVVQGESLMSDAISHSLLSGIVIMYLIGYNQSFFLNFLWIGGVIAAFLAVMMVYWISLYAKVKRDVAIGFVFSYFFSIGVVLISLYAANIHLDIDMVLLGDLVFVPFNRFYLFGYDYGSVSLWSSAIVFCLDSIVIILFYRFLSVMIFDKKYAAVIGFSVRGFLFFEIFFVAINLIVAFEAVGIIASIGMFIVPSATALLIVHSMKDVIWLSVFLSGLGVLAGLFFAFFMDISIAGTIVLSEIALFLIVLCMSRMKNCIAYS